MSLRRTHAETSLPVRDLEQAIAWYRDFLGLEPARFDVYGGARYTLDDGSSFFLYPSSFAGTNQATAMSFQVDEFDETFAELRSRGVTFKDYDLEDFKTEGGVLTTPEGSKVAWFEDSEGNILALSHGM